MTIRLLLLPFSLSMAGCGENCSVKPGRELVPGTYPLSGGSGATGEPLVPYSPPEAAHDVTLTLSENRDEVVIRYRLDGSLYVDRWSVVDSFN